MHATTALSKGPQDLKREVLGAGRCTACGLCAGFCPYIKAVGDKVAIVWDCGRKEGGRCYGVCPRTATDLDALDRGVFGSARGDAILGSHSALLMARARRPEAQAAGQYGGVVTALLLHQLETGAATAAALTAARGGPVPGPAIARDRAAVLAAAGSKYGACPSLVGLNSAVKDEPGAVAVVGRPCQVTAVRKWQSLLDQPLAAKVGLVVGLFCFWALSYRFYDYLAAKMPLASITKIDLPKEDFVVYTSGGAVHLPLDELRPFIRPACGECCDVTAELADIAVGSTEWLDDWNTVLVRSERGRAAFAEAVAAGYLETRPLPAEREQLLRTVVGNKKRRVLATLAGEDGGHGYLRISAAAVRAIEEAR